MKTIKCNSSAIQELHVYPLEGKATVMYNATNGDGGGITIAGSIFLEKGGSYRMNANADLKGGANYSNQITLWWLGGRD